MLSSYLFRCLEKYIIGYWNTFLLEMFWKTFPFEALSWYTSNLRTSIHQILEHLCCLLSRKSSASLHFVVCMWTIFPAVCVLPVVFQKLMSKSNLCFKFCLGVIHQRFKFLWMPCSTNLLRETWNTTMPVFTDQILVRTKLIFTHIIQDGVNCVWGLWLW